MLIPVAEQAGQNAWWFNIIISIASVILCGLAVERTDTIWLRILQGIASAILLAEALRGAPIPWRDKQAEYIVPLTVLLLAELAAEKGMATAARSANILRYGIAAVVGLVLVSGMTETNIKEIADTKGTEMIPLLLLPLIGEGGGRLRNGGLIMALFTVATGIIIAGKESLYELSRSITVLGNSLRFESITAISITLGYYVLSCFLLTTAGNQIGSGFGDYKTGVRISTLIAIGWYLTGINIAATIQSAVIVILWCMIPYGNALWKKMKKVKNNA